MKTKPIRARALVALLCAAACPVQAQSGVGDAVANEVIPQENTFETARGMGMGAGVRAGATGTSAVAYNVANLALVQLYYVDAVIGYIPSDNTWSLGTAVADSASNSLAMGTSFRGIIGNDDRDYKGWDWRAGLGFKVAGPISIGIGMRYAKIKARKDSLGQPKAPSLKTFTMDVALTLTPISWLNISALAYNLIDTKSTLAPRTVGGSVAATIVESFQLGTDVLVDLSTFDDPELIIGAGAEYMAGGQAPLRIGYRRDTGRDQHAITGSLGYTSNTIGAEASIRQEIGGQKETQLVFSVRYQVQ